MKAKSLAKDIYVLLPLVISGLVAIILVFYMYQKLITDNTFKEILNNLTTLFISIGGILSTAIFLFLAFMATTLKKSRHKTVDQLAKITQKMHHFRSIILLLLNSKMWLPGLKEYIDDEFSGLTFFDVKEFYKGKSKLAIEFLQEKHPFQDTENLYLEFKAIIATEPKESNVPEHLKFPSVYSKNIISKWLEHKCGSGLWYYFGYKYGEFKNILDYNAVYERHQEKIMTLANTIDSEVFQDSSFNDRFLAKLGEYMANEVIPQLYQFQDKETTSLPGLMTYLYTLFILLSIFGVLIPVTYLLFNIPIIFIAISYAIVTSTIFYITLSFSSFITKEIES